MSLTANELLAVVAGAAVLWYAVGYALLESIAGGIAFAVIGACLAWLFWQFRTAPEGWQDENGFHYGRPK